MAATNPPARLLVVEDDEVVLEAVSTALERMGYLVEGARGGHEALDLARSTPFDVCILDVGLPDGMTGLDLVTELQALDADVSCVVMTGDTSADTATEAYDRGAVAYLEKPIVDWQRFETLIEQSVRRREAATERVVVADAAAPSADEVAASLRRHISGGSQAMDEVRRKLARAIATGRGVGLVGPTGTGKAHVAGVVHEASALAGSLVIVRADEPGELRDAARRAEGGTLVVTGVDRMDTGPASTLVSLATADEAPRGGRLVLTAEAPVSTWPAGLSQCVEEEVVLPDLASRLEDLPQLVYAFLRDVNEREGLRIRRVPSALIDNLKRRDWSDGNLRALRAVVEQVALFSPGEVLEVDALPPLEQGGVVIGQGGVPQVLPEAYRDLPYTEFKERVLRDFIHLYVHDLLGRTGGNVTRAAELAEMHRPNFRRLMVRFGIEGPSD